MINTSIFRKFFSNNYKYKLISALIFIFVIVSVATPIKASEDQKKNKPYKKYWPSEGNARIEFVQSVAHSGQFKQETGFFGKVVGFIFGGKDEGVRLQRPFGVNTINEKLYIADPAMAAVYRVDFVENRMQEFLYESEGGFFSGGEKYFNNPIDVVSNGEKIFVSDSRKQKVFVFSKEGKFMEQIAGKQLKRPTGLGLDAKNNRLYVSDTLGNKIYIYNTENYKLVKSFGQRGGNPGEFNYPIDISVRNNKVYISDSMNFRVQIFDLDGKFISEFGHLGDGSGDFARPKGIAVDSDGNIYVVDALFGVVQIFNEKGQLLMAFGREGQKLGEFWLPTGIYIDDQDKIYVADSYNHRVQIFEYLGE